MMRSLSLLCAVVVVPLVLPSAAAADPCGMVPPVYTGGGPPIERVGPQKTYVFFKDGVETWVIRPGFSGNVDNFGMLIPFPAVPSIRKVPDVVFSHVAAAIDPPEVVIDLRPRRMSKMRSAPSSAMRKGDSAEKELSVTEVRVIKEEAIGMYQVVVLEAGSAKALNRWMDEHGYKYPDGMDDTANEYIADKWLFVAVKTRVGPKAGVDPRPGMKTADSQLPAGAGFDGFVQAMGFRFEVDKPVVPMRLSAFNEGETRNIVYFLNGDPVKVAGLDKKLVRRQLKGHEVHGNVTGLLPLRIYGGTLEDVPPTTLEAYVNARNPEPHNGVARDLFASDILAAKTKSLAHEYEEREKVFLNISERLNLRGPDIDTLHELEVKKLRTEALGKSVDDLNGMTLTVLDGDFPRAHIAKHNITFERWQLARADNTRLKYSARDLGPIDDPGGVRVGRDQKQNPFLKLWRSVWD